MPLHSDSRFPVMCLTQDGLALGHAEQAARLCAAGARWVQLRMKEASLETWIATARAVVAVCRDYHAISIINDSVEVALAAGADGVHLGREDLDWSEARKRLGSDRLIGGTVNHEADVQRVHASGCLDYVGVGPLRFTTTKRKLAPVLGIDGVRALVVQLTGIPTWVIGGVESADMPAVRAIGAAGAAVSSALFRNDCVGDNFRGFLAAWNAKPGAGAETTHPRSADCFLP